MLEFLYLDCETGGLDPEVHPLIEVAWALGDAEPKRLILPHSVENAESEALMINHYYERGLDEEPVATQAEINQLNVLLKGAHIAGSNPAFDVAFLREAGFSGWHHRLMDVPLYMAGFAGWEESKGLFRTTTELLKAGYDIPIPDHTAIGDVLTTRAIHKLVR